MEYAQIMLYLAIGTCIGFIALTLIVGAVIIIFGSYLVNQGRYFRRKFYKLLDEYPIEPKTVKKKSKLITISLLQLLALNNAFIIVKAIEKEIE